MHRLWQRLSVATAALAAQATDDHAWQAGPTACTHTRTHATEAPCYRAHTVGARVPASRACMVHASPCRIMLNKDAIFRRFFDKVEVPNFEVASDAFNTFKVGGCACASAGGSVRLQPEPLRPCKLARGGAQARMPATGVWLLPGSPAWSGVAWSAAACVRTAGRQGIGCMHICAGAATCRDALRRPQAYSLTLLPPPLLAQDLLTRHKAVVSQYLIDNYATVGRAHLPAAATQERGAKREPLLRLLAPPASAHMLHARAARAPVTHTYVDPPVHPCMPTRGGACLQAVRQHPCVPTCTPLLL